MKYAIKAHYAAPSQVLMKMFADKSYHSRKLEGLGIPKHEILECSKQGNAFRIKIQFALPIQAPGMVKKMVSADTKVTQEEEWDTARGSGRISVSTHGMPVEMTCQATASDDARGCLLTNDWTIVARIPLIGGSLEKFICTDLQGRAEKEQRVINSLLDQYR